MLLQPRLNTLCKHVFCGRRLHLGTRESTIEDDILKKFAQIWFESEYWNLFLLFVVQPAFSSTLVLCLQELQTVTAALKTTPELLPTALRVAPLCSVEPLFVEAFYNGLVSAFHCYSCSLMLEYPPMSLDRHHHPLQKKAFRLVSEVVATLHSFRSSKRTPEIWDIWASI